ncbi:MAG: hypothetical protein ACHBN1_29735 [Heteroscytonema crispum UTEX LB 1556]
MTLSLQAARNIKVKAVNQYGLMLKQIKKVRRDLPEPKQLSLFETPILTSCTWKSECQNHNYVQGELGV